MKKIQLITKILAVALIVAIAFIGVYVQKQNRMENIVKDYTWGMDLTGARVIEFTVSDEKETITKDKDGKIVKEEDKEENGEYTTEEKPVNSDEVKTAENYKKSKQILENRLAKFGVNDYIIKLDEDTGKIVIEIPENDQTDHIVSNVSQVGKFEIVDSVDTEKVLMDNSDIKLSSVMYNTTMTGTTVYLNIEFNKEGTEKLKNISNEYKKGEETTSEEATETETTETETTDQTSKSEETTEENAEKSKQKEITMQIDGSKMITTSFDETMENGVIQLSMGQATKDKEKLSEYMQNTSTMATVLDTGNIPVEYEVEENKYVVSDITKDMLTKLAIVEATVALCAIMILIIKHKKLGLLASIAYIGFVALYLLLIRYTNVTITLEGISAIAVIFTLNYVFNFKLLNKIKEYGKEDRNKAIKDTFKSFTIKTIPIWILSIVFCFMSWIPISSFGMAMFWGLILIELYNIVLTRSIIKD